MANNSLTDFIVFVLIFAIIRVNSNSSALKKAIAYKSFEFNADWALKSRCSYLKKNWILVDED